MKYFAASTWLYVMASCRAVTPEAKIKQRCAPYLDQTYTYGTTFKLDLRRREEKKTMKRRQEPQEPQYCQKHNIKKVRHTVISFDINIDPHFVEQELAYFDPSKYSSEM